VHRPVRRIAVPIATLAVVLLTFVAEPWLKGEGKSKGSVRDQLQAGARSMEEGLQGKIGKASNLNVDDLNNLAPRAREALESLKDSDVVKSIQGKLADPGKSFESSGSRGGGSRNPR